MLTLLCSVWDSLAGKACWLHGATYKKNQSSLQWLKRWIPPRSFFFLPTPNPAFCFFFSPSFFTLSQIFWGNPTTSLLICDALGHTCFVRSYILILGSENVVPMEDLLQWFLNLFVLLCAHLNERRHTHTYTWNINKGINEPINSLQVQCLDGRGVWGRIDTCIRLAQSLCYPPETIPTLFIGYTPI